MTGPLDFLYSMEPEERRLLLDNDPVLHALARAEARAIMGTDIDPTVDAIAERIKASSVMSRENASHHINDLLTDLVTQGQRAFPNDPADPTMTQIERMRLLDAMWLGILVHEHRHLLFPDLFPKEES